MSDNNNDNGGAKLTAPRKLQLTKTVESGKIQQSFSRGKSKTVTVEVKKTRTFSRDTSGKMRQDAYVSSTDKEEIENLEQALELESHLTDQEREKRLQVIEQARVAAESKSSLEPDEAQSTDQADDDDALVEETSSEALEDAVGSDRSQESKRKVLTVIQDAPTDPETIIAENEKASENAHRFIKVDKPNKDTKLEDAETKEQKKKKAAYEIKRKTKLTISNAFEHQEDRMQSLAAVRRRRQKVKRQNEGGFSSDEKAIREIILPESIQVVELANRMAVRVTDVIKELMKLGIMATANQVIDADTAELVVNELGHTVKRVSDADVEDILSAPEIKEDDLTTRAPVVTIMGHVDHGKTSLLDALHKTNVTAGEAGGITQHIGAYQISTEADEKITFLDTPGHAAFTAMRKRGAHVTDIVVLVVAADDGIMPQTIEAIHHAKAAEVPIIVAINKIDKPDADPSRVKNELLQHELVPEDMGGDIQVVEVSAIKGTNLDGLIEAILLQSEMLELKASSNMLARGSVIEAEVDKGRGVVATILIQQGTLNIGDIVVAGCAFGKVKTISDSEARSLERAGPSLPVELLGLNECPNAGDDFAVCQTEKQARDIVEFRRKRDLEARSAAKVGATDTESLNLLFESAAGGKKELRLIIKGDVQGSVEAIMGSLEKLNNDEVSVKFVHQAAGGITESDVQLAAASGAAILGFNVRAPQNVKQLAQDERVEIRYYSIIYNLIDDMKSAIGGMMSPVLRESYLGNAIIQQVFKMSKYGKVAGCLVKDGFIKRGAGVRLIRDDVVIHEGTLKTLKRFKEDVNEVRDNTECGMQFENYEDIKEGDTIEAFEIIEEQRVLD